MTGQSRRRLLRPLLLALLVALPASAQVADPFGDAGRDVNKRGSTASEFLSIPVGARATSMGNAVAATSSDATALYWNPAGLTQMRGAGLTVEYADWFSGIDFGYTAVTLPLGGGMVAASVTSMQTADIEVTTEDAQNGTGQTYTAGSYAVTLGYGRSLTDRFSIGASVKYIQERIYNSNATGLAFDVGTLFTTPFRGIRLGASISNFGDKMQISGDDLRTRVDIDPNNQGNGTGNTALLETDRYDLPLTMRIGLSGELYRSNDARLTLAFDALSPNNSEQYLNAGMEAALFGEMVFLRAGYAELLLPDAVRGLTLGGGIAYRVGPVDLEANYAYEQMKWLGDVSRVSLAIGF